MEDFAPSSDFKVLSMGSRWNCLVPTINDSEDSANKDSLAAPPNPFEVAARLNGIQCLYQIQDGRYWQYEFCSKKSIKQFHPLPPNQVPGKNDEYFLGVYSTRTKPEIVMDTSVDGVKFYYLKEEWGDGTVCDLNGDRRTTIVEYYCAQEEKFLSIRETASCNYKIVVYTPKLCINPSFVRQRSTKVAKIQCKPNYALKDINLDANAAISIQKAMGMESPKKKTVRQKERQNPINFADLKVHTADMAEGLDNVLKKLAQKDNLAAIVEAAGFGDVAENMRQVDGEAVEGLGPDVSIIYLRDADGKMKQVKKDAKKPMETQETHQQESGRDSAEKEETKGDEENAEL